MANQTFQLASYTPPKVLLIYVTLPLQEANNNTRDLVSTSISFIFYTLLLKLFLNEGAKIIHAFNSV